MPDIVDPPFPRPKKKLLASGHWMCYDAYAEWQVGTEVWFFYSDGSKGHPLNATYTFADNSQVGVFDGSIFSIS